MSLKDRIADLNKRIALKATLWIGTMWCVYGFMVFALIPFVFPGLNTAIQYISSAFLQLVFLPLIMVGSAVLGEKAEVRAQQDHEMLMAELAEIKEMHAELKELLAYQKAVVTMSDVG